MKKKISAIQVVTIYSIYFLMSTLLIINPALQGISEMYAEIPYTRILLLATLPSVMVACLAAPSGMLVGRKISYKAMIVIAALLQAIGGILPVFVHDFGLMIFARIVYGAGVGLSAPLVSAIIMRLFEGEQRAAMLGFGGTVNSVTGIIYQFLSGQIAAVSIRASWLVHLIVLLPMLLTIFFLPSMDGTEGEKPAEKKRQDPAGAQPAQEAAKQQVQQSAAQPAHKKKMPAAALVICVGWGIFYMLYSPQVLNTSSIVAEKGVGNAAIAGIVLMMATIGGMVGGLLFGRIYRVLKDLTFPVVFLLQGLGMVICFFTGQAFFLMAGMFCVGMASCMLQVAALMDLGVLVSEEQLSSASGIFMSLWNLGTFCSTFFIGLVTRMTGSTLASTPVLAAFVCMMLLGAAWCLLRRSAKKKGLL